MYYNLKPIDFEHANSRLTGFDLPDHLRHLSIKKDAEALPAYFDGKQRITIWKCSFLGRLLFLFRGQVNLIELTSNPKTCPKALSIGKAFSSGS